MLDPWIIEQIRKREEERQREIERPRIDVPLERPPLHDSKTPPNPTPPTDEGERGVVVIDL